MKFTPENIEILKNNQIFIYGSNAVGKHGLGAAKQALKFGAQYGKVGLAGQSYGLNTKDKYLNVMSLSEIKFKIEILLNYVKSSPEKEWLLTKVGTGLSGYSIEEIAELFLDFLPLPDNLVVPKEFYDYWQENGWKTL